MWAGSRFLRKRWFQLRWRIRPWSTRPPRNTKPSCIKTAKAFLRGAEEKGLHSQVFKLSGIRSRPANQRKGENEKFMNFAHFCEFWCFSLGKQARFTLNFCSGMPLRKVHEPTFLWFGLPGPLLSGIANGGGFQGGAFSAVGWPDFLVRTSALASGNL